MCLQILLSPLVLLLLVLQLLWSPLLLLLLLVRDVVVLLA
jgi:hypothetical protein